MIQDTRQDAGTLPLKSISDLKTYKILELSNGLECLLISTMNRCQDIDIDNVGSLKSAAAMSIQVGSFSDPYVAEGLAHFLEHMVFMGSEKYPVENHYDNFVSSAGGSCNAFTEGEYTVYQFDVMTKYFAEALDIFAQCLMSPLLSYSAADREIEAIESEFNIALMDDYNRYVQLLSHDSLNSLEAYETQHVFSKFSWGNKKSLVDIPASNSIDMKSLIKSFHNKYYTPSSMKLVCIAAKTLSEIESDVKLSFDFSSSYPTTMKSMSSNNPHLSELLMDFMSKFINVMPIKRENFNVLHRIIPVKKQHKLIISWQLPSTVKDYRCKSASYISYVLGFEGHGSLLNALKALGYAESLSAGVSGSNIEENSMFSIFTVIAKLTKKGFVNWIHVVKIIFAYVEMMKVEGPQEWIFKEISAVEAMRFDYLDEEEEEDLAERLAIAMLPCSGVERKDLLWSSIKTVEWNPDTVIKLMEMMTPDRSRIDVFSSFYKSQDVSVYSGIDSIDSENSSDGQGTSEDNSTSDCNDDSDDGNIDSDNDEPESLEESDENVEIKIKLMYSGPENWIHLVEHPNPDTVKVEPHFQTKFWVDSFPEDLMSYWLINSASVLVSPNTSITESFQQIPVMTLPPKNPYIPEDLTLRQEDSEQSTIVKNKMNNSNLGQIIPLRILEKDGFSCWYLFDANRFPMPKVEIMIRLISPVVNTSNFESCFVSSSRIVASILHDLSTRILRDIINEQVYLASMADLYCDIENSHDIGINIKISGFSENASLLALHVLSSYYLMPTQNCEFEDVFNREYELLMKEYENSNMKASNAVYNSRMAILVPTLIPSYDKFLFLLNNKDRINLTILSSYLSNVLDNLYVEMLLQGNVTQVEALHFATLVYNLRLQDEIIPSELLNAGNVSSVIQLDNKPSQKSVYSNKNHPNLSVINISPLSSSDVNFSSITVKNISQNINERSICVEFLYQLGPYDCFDLTILDLIEHIIYEPFFDELRTKQQLGYSVSCGSRLTKGILFFYFQVLSSSYTVDHVENSIRSFICFNLMKILEGLNSTQFSTYKQTLADKKALPDVSLKDSAASNWYEIEQRQYDFTSKLKQASYLKFSNDVHQVLSFPQRSVSFNSLIDDEDGNDKEITLQFLVEYSRQLFFEKKKLLIIQIHLNSYDSGGILSTDETCSEIGSAVVVDMRQPGHVELNKFRETTAIYANII